MSIYNKNNLLCYEVASKNPLREELNGVLFKKDRTCATDSYIMLEVKNNEKFTTQYTEYPILPDKSTILTNFAKKGYIVPIGSVKKALANLKEVKSDVLPILQNSVFLNSQNQQSSKIASYDLEKTDIVSTKNIEGDFPDYEKAIPNTDKGFTKINLDINKLKQIIDVISKMELKGTQNEIALFVKADNSRIVIKAITEQDQSITGVVMPIMK